MNYILKVIFITIINVSESQPISPSTVIYNSSNLDTTLFPSFSGSILIDSIRANYSPLTVYEYNENKVKIKRK